MQLICSVLMPTCTGYAKIHYGTFPPTNPMMKFISRAEIYFTLISSTLDSLEPNIRSEMTVYSGVMGCGKLGFPESAILEQIGGKLADYRVYMSQDAPERTCMPRNEVSG